MPEDLKNRTCVTCACAYLVEPPRVPTAEQLAADPDIQNRKPLRICRLNPPAMVHIPVPQAMGPPKMVPKLMQQPVDDYFSCWHWKAEGTLPGDALPLNNPGLRLYDGN